jgi:hypothetical protein
MDKTSKFARWFNAQFGGMPVTYEYMRDLIQQRANLLAAAAELDRKIKRYEELNLQWKVASYTRSASEKAFKF